MAKLINLSDDINIVEDVRELSPEEEEAMFYGDVYPY